MDKIFEQRIANKVASYLATVKRGDLDLFLVHFMITYLTATN